MNFKEAEAYLYSLKHHGAKYGIDRMRVLMDRIGHPEEGFPVIHVAGTNGKGSVCAMLESIYRKAGYRTGLFTSPHLVYVGERIQVNGESISKEALIRYIKWLKPIADEIGTVDSDDHPSFFEFINAIGFQYFVDEGIDIGIIETGLGGEKDSTNVVNPLASVITTIGMDHSEILGNSIELIARAKAGILKRGKALVLGDLGSSSLAVVEGIAKDLEVSVFKIGDRFGRDWPEVVLKGDYQRKNAAVAQLVVEVLREEMFVSGKAIKEGLRSVVWPGRFQEIELSGGRSLILDVAHNEEGARALVENLSKIVSTEEKKLVVMLGATSELRGKALIEALHPYAREFVFLEVNHSKGVPASVLSGYLSKSYDIEFKSLTFSDLSFVGMGKPGDCLLVVGSIYLVGEVLKLLNDNSLSV